MFCCALLYVNSSFAIILTGKRELVALLCLSSWCLPIFVWLFLTIPRVCMQFVIVVFPDHTQLLFVYTVVLVNCLYCWYGDAVRCVAEDEHYVNVFISITLCMFDSPSSVRQQ